jgi:hypothetical protein
MNTISRFAALCRQNHATRPADLRATDWHLCGGAGPLKSVRDQVVAEIARQSEFSAERRNRALPAVYRPLTRLLNVLAAKRELAARLASARPLSACGSDSTGEFRCGPVLVSVRQAVEEDWDRYSKGWHRNHGPARTYSTTITVSRWNESRHSARTFPQSGLRNMDRRAVEAVAEFLALPKLRGRAGLRIDSHVELAEVASPSKRCTLFERRLAGEVLGVVAVRRGEHYHAGTAEAACAGVTEKIARARLARQRSAVSAAIGLDLERPIGAILRSLGFCKEGTADALDALGLDDRRWDIGELVAAGRWENLPILSRKYPSEVGTVVSVLGNLALPESIRNLLSGIR